MKFYTLSAAAVMSVVSVSAAQVETAESEPASTGLLLGLGGTTLIAPALGFAPSTGVAVRVKRVLIMGEGFLGFDSGHIDLFYGGAGGTIFGNGRWSPYVLAGAGYLARSDGDSSGREALALTLEAGMVLARAKGGQIWLGARAFIPLETLHASDYHGNPPQVPILSLNLRFWLGVL